MAEHDGRFEVLSTEASANVYYVVQAEYSFQQGTMNAPEDGLHWLWTFSDRAEAEQYVEDLHNGRRRNGLYYLRHREYARPEYVITPMSREQVSELARRESMGFEIDEKWWENQCGRQRLEESREESRANRDILDACIIKNAPHHLRSEREEEIRKLREREDKEWRVYPPQHR